LGRASGLRRHSTIRCLSGELPPRNCEAPASRTRSAHPSYPSGTFGAPLDFHTERGAGDCVPRQQILLYVVIFRPIRAAELHCPMTSGYGIDALDAARTATSTAFGAFDQNDFVLDALVQAVAMPRPQRSALRLHHIKAPSTHRDGRCNRIEFRSSQPA
jgi:hypothetical protein